MAPSTEPRQSRDVATAWARAFGEGDLSTLEALSGPPMRIWHSYDDQWLDRDEGAARLAEADVADMPTPQQVRVHTTDEGFVLRAWIDAGPEIGKTHVLQFCVVDGGQVSSCEEYIAPAMAIG